MSTQNGLANPLPSPVVRVTPEVMAWARETWEQLSDRDRVLLKIGLRALAPKAQE